MLTAITTTCWVLLLDVARPALKQRLIIKTSNKIKKVIITAELRAGLEKITRLIKLKKLPARMAVGSL